MRTDTAAPAEIPGLVIRRYRGEEDLAGIVRVTNAEHEADGTPERHTVEELAAELRHVSESFDPSADFLVAEIDGQIIGHARVDWVDTTDGLREYRTGGRVDPPWRRRGIGRTLMRANVARLGKIAAGHATDRPHVLGLWTSERSAGGTALAESEGFRPERWFLEMERPGIDRDLPELPEMPAGLEVRPLSKEQTWQLWEADVEAFQDHWGGFDASEANFQRWTGGPNWNPELVVVAWDRAHIAGAVINTIYAAENAELGIKRGWLDSVFTRRAWRKRGLARALIARSLHVLAERGMDTAALGVDADNPSGALGLYESFGFAVVHGGQAWRKPMEVSS